MMLIPPALIYCAPAPDTPPDMARRPDHPKARGFEWVGSVLLKNEGVPVQRLHLFLDLKALRKVLQEPSLKGLDPGESALQACAAGKVPHAWRGEYLADIGGAFRGAMVRSLLRTHWPTAAFDPERPTVKAFLARCVAPRNQGDWVEEVLVSGAVYSRFRLEAWAAFEDPELYRARCSSGFAFQAEGRAEWSKLLKAAVAP